jgi:multiple sugar transport system ATP-binding protein
VARVQLRNVTKRFKHEPVIRNVTLDIEDEEFFVLVGPSGCGKSTTLRMIAGLEEPTAGDILIGGEVVNDLPPKDRNIAMVFQNYALYPSMTVGENMAFGLKLRGYSEKEIESRVSEAAEVLEIRPLLKSRLVTLSGGQLQRVAVGRAIVRKPRVFLFDEPLSNLDAKLRVQMRGMLGRLHQRLQTTMIYVTHDQVEAMTLGDRVCVMKEGSVQQVSRPLDIYRRPANAFVAQFVGQPAMNFFEVTAAVRGNRLWLDNGHFQLPLPPRYVPDLLLQPGQKLLLGLRPEDVHDRLFDPGDASEGAYALAVVEWAEPVGPETYLHLNAGGTRFIARVDPNNPAQVNQHIGVTFDMEKAHLFALDGSGSRLEPVQGDGD